MREKIAKWYKQGLWSAEMVQKAVEKGVLTAEEAAQIFEEKEHSYDDSAAGI